tara:strand:+ start:2899 stop:4797 length:1899 start_codon:yes stop_codon:yes gene_type:complete
MCGINGIIYKNSNPDIHEVHKMNKAIKHRGPDDEGLYKFENIILGHVRLAILDISRKGKQPMSNDSRYWITYNGEIYNFQELKKQLIDLGHKFYSKTDTEVILSAFKEWGIKSFYKFNGMWSFAILDTKEKKIILSRDRYGVKPCYYYQDKKKFVFSSEIKGIFASNSEIEIDKNKMVLSSKDLEKSFTTIYQNLDIIPPGCLFAIDLKNNKINKTRWWNGLENLPEINVNIKSNEEKLRELLIHATKERLVSDVKIATSLSGGVDSSIIFSILNNLVKKNNCSNINLNPFIVKYGDNQTIEEAIKLSKHFNKKPIIVNYDEDSYDNFSEKLSSIEISEPYFSQLEVYKSQNENGFKVSIDGHGADESLGGYWKDIQNFALFFQNNLVDLHKAIINILGMNEFNKIVKKLNLMPDIHGFKIDIKNHAEIKFKPSEYIQNKPSNLTHAFLYEDLKKIEEYEFPLQVLYLNSAFGHLQWLLNKWDKASMASSVEIRSPFMDWRFFQFALALPASIKIKDGQNKSILRNAFKEILPDYIQSKKIKQGLPLIKFRKPEFAYNLIQDTINENDFKNNNIWDSKKIISDFNNEEIRKEKMNKILMVVRTFLMHKGFENRKNKLNKQKNESKISFNKLN